MSNVTPDSKKIYVSLMFPKTQLKPLLFSEPKRQKDAVKSKTIRRRSKNFSQCSRIRHKCVSLWKQALILSE